MHIRFSEGGAYLPVGLGKGGTLVEDIVGAGRVTSLGSTRFSLTSVTGRVPNGIGTGPITTEGVGKDVKVFGKELVRITSVSSEVGSGSSPSSRIGLLVGNIARNVVSAKEPNSDTGLSPFDCYLSADFHCVPRSLTHEHRHHHQHG
jgi:hypothetical protein